MYGGIPKEAWTDKKLNYSFLRTFGCEAFVDIDKENRTKLEDKSNKYTLIGYGFYYFCYHLWHMKITKSLGLDMWYSMKRLCRNISCRKIKRRRKTKST